MRTFNKKFREEGYPLIAKKREEAFLLKMKVKEESYFKGQGIKPLPPLSERKRKEEKRKKEKEGIDLLKGS